ADRPGADDDDHVTLADLPVLHADLESGRQDVREHRALLGRDAVRKRDQAVVGEGHPHILGLSAVDEVTEDPTDATERLAVRGQAAAAVVTLHALADAGDDHSVTDRNLGACLADLGDDANPLVPEDP